MTPRVSALGWVVTAFLTGLLLAGGALGLFGYREQARQYEARLGEARMRQEILRVTVELLGKDKFQTHAATLEAMRRVAREER